MGWDCFAMGPKGGIITDRKIKNAFKEAGNWVHKRCGVVDGGLNGKWCMLDVSTCGEMLHRASGKHHYSENPWHPAQMTFDWNFGPDDDDDWWAYWSARKFIEVCQKYNLTIRFSW